MRAGAENTELFYSFFTCQEPRPLSQADLEKALSTSRKTSVAANEYSRMTSRTSFPGESGDSQVEAAIRELSKIMGVSHIQVDAQD